MPKFKIVYLLLFFISFQNISYSQLKVMSSKDISKLLDKASEYYSNANFIKSLTTSKLALKFATDTNDELLIAKSYRLIGKNFYQLAEIDKSIYFYEKALLHANKTDSDTLKIFIYNNLGNAYSFEKNELKKGLTYYEKSLEISNQINDTTEIILTKLNIAWADFESQKFEEGFPYLEFVNKYNDKYGEEGNFNSICMLNGMYYAHKGQNKIADSYFQKGLKKNKDFALTDDAMFLTEQYSKFLYKIGDYKNAFKYNKLSEEINDKYYNKDKLKQASSAGMNIELDEYKNEIKKIITEKDTQFQILKKSRVISILSIIIISVLLLLLYALLKNFNLKKKNNTELTNANQQLKIAKERAEETSKLKTQFVATISHELRTPLYGVIGITDIIIDEHKNIIDTEHLNSLKFSARYLLELVNDILQLNKMEDNKIVLNKVNFNLYDEINTIKNALQYIAEINKNKFRTEIDAQIPKLLIGDELRLSQILMNLISNALKFTKNGEVIVSANLVNVIGNKNYIKFQVIDNGFGIAKEHQEKIFDKFVQIQRKDDDYQGTGLGLAIVKRLVDLFGSEIYIDSKENIGSTFTFTISFEASNSSEVIEKPKDNLFLNTVLNILVVEDNKINQMVTKKIIEKNNHNCVMVSGGFEAIDAVSKQNFDVILMDINMPEINGYETSIKMRENGITTPIIALTAFDKNEVTDQATAAGINDVLIKPFETQKLFEIIYQLLHKTKNAD